ncbi:MAG: response regulator [Rhodospirillaceae bacterium]|nr:response regulator [Rhodospirillaceae bacterium]
MGKGSGLGLSMVHGFVAQSKGHVRIESEPGRGTTVRLYLPQSDAEARDVPAAGGDRAGRPVEGGDETILLVEDDALVREHVRDQLAALGYRAVAAANGAEALELLRRGDRFDLLFTDVVMPGGMSGVDLAERARALRPGLPVLFTSGYTEDAMLGREGLDRTVELLKKPYRREDLAEKLRAALG